MALSEQQKYLAGKIDKFVQKKLARGGPEAVLTNMIDHMATFKRVMDSSTQEQMDELCQRYEGFHYFSQVLQNMAQGVQDGSIEVP